LKILVCMKQVPQKDAPLKLNESGTWIREDVSYEVNEPDAYALEEALRSLDWMHSIRRELSPPRLKKTHST
jgi:electron transfer flavoprotein alpha/beta subunit